MLPSPSRANRFRRRHTLVLPPVVELAILVLGWLGVAWATEGAIAAETRLPNIILILADDLGYGELGCYGQRVIETPRLDRLAAEGMRFTDFYAGSTVCAPSRCVLMTGLHTGHARVRGNGAAQITSLKKQDLTVAKLLKQAGYATALCGKWGLGELPGSEGLPNNQCFDHFFGYLNQTHAHNYYPEFLWRNTEQMPLGNIVSKPNPSSPGGWATKKVAYSADLITDDAVRFVEANHDKPFFLYWATTIPHVNNEARAATGDGHEVPGYGIYADRPWPNPDKGHAAMITRLDADVGRLLDTLDRLGIADNTLILFTSDNGPHREGGLDRRLFQPAGPLRGSKRDLYDGGIRVPLIARWPAKIAAGAVADHISYHGDLLATVAEIVGQPAPPSLDSLSLLPTFTGQGEQMEHETLYWEFYEQGSKQAVRWRNWKAVRMPMVTGPIELYDLASDLGETNDVAAAHPDVVARLAGYMEAAHVPDANWQPSGEANVRREFEDK
jgi:arylsulfatase A-like enzyme